MMLSTAAASVLTVVQIAAPSPEPSPPPPPPLAEAPAVVAPSVVLYADQGRLELDGAHLLGARLQWAATFAGAATAGEDTCLEPRPAGKAQHCSFAVPRTLRADSPLALLPAT